MARLKSLVLMGIFLLHSCASSLPEHKKKKVELDLPSAYDKNLNTGEEASNIQLIKWKQYFTDKELINLIEIGLSNSQELNILDQDIEIRRNEIKARRGEYIPNLNFKAGYESEKVGEFTSQGVADANLEYEPGKVIPENQHKHTIGLTSSWEIDIWGKLRNATKAAYLEYRASEEVKKFAVTRFVSEVATSYYELMALDQQTEIVQEYIKILKKAKSLVEAQQSAARVTSLAVKRFEAEVLKNEVRQYELKQQTIEQENKINYLVGRLPQPILRSKLKFAKLLPEILKAGIPSELLDNRPDIKAASFELEASKFSVRSAKARFYPAFSIEAGAGYQSFNREHLYDTPGSVFYNLGVNLTAPLLNRAAIEADYFSANNRQIQAIYEYEKTVITAYTEVVNKLSQVKNIREIVDIRSKQAKALLDSVEISGILFKSARVDYVEALLTQRESLDTEIELVEAKKSELLAYVDLYKSLGGGWK